MLLLMSVVFRSVPGPNASQASSAAPPSALPKPAEPIDYFDFTSWEQNVAGDISKVVIFYMQITTGIEQRQQIVIIDFVFSLI